MIMQRPMLEAEEHPRPVPAAGRRAQQPAPAGATSQPPDRPAAASPLRAPAQIPLTQAMAAETAPDPGGPVEEWYVGIAGEPVGPKAIGFLREKLEAGAINGSSLVWKEDLPDWKPLRAIPLLAALLPDDIAPERTSTAGVEAAAAGSAGARIADAAPAGAVPAAAVSHPVALTRIKDDEEGLGPGPAEPRREAGGAAAAVAATSLAGPASLAPSPAEGLAFGRPAGQREADDLLLEEEQGAYQRERRRRRRGMKPIAWAFVAMAGGFGAVAAYVVFSSPPSVQPSSASAASALAGTSPTATGTAAPTIAASGEPAPPTASTIVLDVVSVGRGADSAGRPSGLGSARAATGPASGTADIDTSGFSTGGPLGPTSGPSGGSSSTSRGELTQAEIASVVNGQKGGVSRKCMPIVEAGSPSGATSARVVVRIMIGPSGNVDSASASGGKDFPGLADCVVSRVRNWKFPASNGSTPVDVPFHFIAQ